MVSYDFSKLKGKMVECGYNQGTLAKAIGISPTTMSLKMKGKRDFTLTELFLMAKVLKIEDADPYFFENVLKFS